MKIQLASNLRLYIRQRDTPHPTRQSAGYYEAEVAIKADQVSGKMPKHPLVKGDVVKRRQSTVQPEETTAQVAPTNYSRQVEL